MNTGKSNYLLLGVLSVALLGLGVLGGGSYGSDLVDDSTRLRSGLTQDNGELRSVQGARDTGVTSETSPCPADKPVIGWIDYAGERKIRTSLPEGEFASACFETTQKALLAGYQN